MKIRLAELTDRKEILRLAERLADFSIPEWRTNEEIVAGDVRILEKFFANRQSSQHLYVAEDQDVTVGILFLEERKDYFTNEKLLHISVLAVAKEYSGQGLGSKLLNFSENLAKDLLISKLSLSVFVTNQLAKAVYDKKGFREETVFMTKSM